jgi:hypothetical protein
MSDIWAEQSSNIEYLKSKLWKNVDEKNQNRMKISGSENNYL